MAHRYIQIQYAEFRWFVNDSKTQRFSIRAGQHKNKSVCVYFRGTFMVVYWTKLRAFPAEMILYKLEVSLMIHSEIVGVDTQPLPSLISKKWDSEGAQQSVTAQIVSDSIQPLPPVALNHTACFACELCICIVIQIPILFDGSCCWECPRWTDNREEAIRDAATSDRTAHESNNSRHCSGSVWSE